MSRPGASKNLRDRHGYAAGHPPCEGLQNRPTARACRSRRGHRTCPSASTAARRSRHQRIASPTNGDLRRVLARERPPPWRRTPVVSTMILRPVRPGRPSGRRRETAGGVNQTERPCSRRARDLRPRLLPDVRASIRSRSMSTACRWNKTGPAYGRVAVVLDSHLRLAVRAHVGASPACAPRSAAGPAIEPARSQRQQLRVSVFGSRTQALVARALLVDASSAARRAHRRRCRTLRSSATARHRHVTTEAPSNPLPTVVASQDPVENQPGDVDVTARVTSPATCT